MIKCEVIKEFTLARYDELKNIKRRNFDTKGKLYVGDTFECTEKMADYLTGNNALNKTVVKVIEVKPEITINEEKVKEIVIEKPKRKKTSKK